MRDSRGIWIGLADLLLCVVSVVIVAVAPTKAKTDGVKPKAEYLIQMTYPIGIDEDVDLWVARPQGAPVFYGSRQNGCADLDRDTLGNSTSIITLDDGTKVQDKANTETTSIRCFEPGVWAIGVNLYSEHGHGDKLIPVHIEVTGINPNVRTIWAGDVTLDHTGQTVNVVSFDMSKDGELTRVDPPLEPITDRWTKFKPGTPP